MYPIANSWCDGFNKLFQLYQNIIQRGENLLDVDPRRVRSSVIKMMRTVDEDHGHLPRDGNGDGNGGFIAIDNDPNEAPWVFDTSTSGPLSPYSTILATTSAANDDDVGLIGLSDLDLSAGFSDDYQINYSQEPGNGSSHHHQTNDITSNTGVSHNLEESFSHWFDFNLK